MSGRAAAAHPEFLRLFILLLLSGGVDDEQDSVIRNVRRQGWQRLHDSIRRAYLPAGEQAADRVADQLTDFAFAAFDGAFLAVQVNPDAPYSQLMDQMTQALLALGDAILATSDTESPS